MGLQSLCFGVGTARVALYRPLSRQNRIPTRCFLARDAALGYRNAALLATAFDLFFCITENKSALFSGMMSSSKSQCVGRKKAGFFIVSLIAARRNALAASPPAWLLAPFLEAAGTARDCSWSVQKQAGEAVHVGSCSQGHPRDVGFEVKPPMSFGAGIAQLGQHQLGPVCSAS